MASSNRDEIPEKIKRALAARDTVVMRSPSTEEKWQQADVLQSELKAWDVRESEALGFVLDEVMSIFYPDGLGDTRQESMPPAGCLDLAVGPDAD